MMIIQANYFFNAIFYPVFFFWVGTEAQFTQFQAGKLRTWTRIFFLFLIATVGKVLGSWILGVMLGFHWQDSLAAGLLLNIKGHFHVYLAIMALSMNFTSVSTSISLVFATILTTIYAPLVVASIIKRARKHAPTQRMAIQWLSPSNELRILLCLHGPQHIASAANFMAISRGPSEPGILVYLTDMIELTDRIAATLTHNEGMDTVSVTDPAVVEKRDQISNGVNAYLDEDGEGITMQRMLALSTLSNMHQDVCILAEDLMASLIVLPFHKQQEPGGRLNLGHAGFRHVNRKILRHSPCSVGILVDRGLGATVMSRTSISLYAAVIFIGGKDDREALAYAGRVACHSGVKMTVIRFLVEATGDSVSSIITMAKANTLEHQEEMKVDDECFADFYDRAVRSFHRWAGWEGELDPHGGMNDWEECPELGPIGDILSASDFSATASVLVIQQHSLKGELDGLQEEFSIM
ncbi:hypothetical protein C2S51_038919 [Perilla frutescens var. frutescens]|nr:hypothetical protein C2S51_038919 [Perilla frutescens var. frutescens]